MPIRMRDITSLPGGLFNPPGSTPPVPRPPSIEIGQTSIETGPQTISTPDAPSTRPPRVEIGQDDPQTNPNELQPVTLKYGQPSRRIFFDTFFDDFFFTCEPKYRRYVVDESTDDMVDPLEKLEDAPRLIYLSWHSAPALPVFSAASYPDVGTGMDTLAFTSIPGITDGDSAPVPTTLASDSMNPGAVAIRISDTEPVQFEVRPIDEESVITSQLFSRMHVSEVMSDSTDAETAGVRVDSLGTTATTPRRIDRFESVRVPPIVTAPLSFNAVMVGDAALGMLSAQGNQAESRESTESALIISAFSTEIALLDVLEDVAGETAVEPPSQVTSQVSPSLTYAGYLIERQQLDQNGVFVDDRRFTISGATRTNFYDTGVAYGRVYRYRISSIVRWVHRAGIDLSGLTLTVPQESTSVQNQMVTRYMRSSWSPYFTTVVLDTNLPPPPIDVIVRTISKKKQVHVSWVVPYNSESDIVSLNLWRREMKSGTFSTGWTLISGPLPVMNGLYVDKAVSESVEYVYALTSISVHGQESPLSEQMSCELVHHGDEQEPRMVSTPGVLLSARGNMSVIPFMKMPGDVLVRHSVTLSPRTGQSSVMNVDKDMIVRLQSLDTGETIDETIFIRYKNFVEPNSLSRSRGGPSPDFVVPVEETQAQTNQPLLGSLGV